MGVVAAMACDPTQTMVATTQDAPAAPAVDLVLLGLAVAAVSTSAPLIRVAAAPAMAIALWRNLLAVPVLAPFAVGGLARMTSRERRLTVYAGLLLAAHFAAWIPSLSYTSVASSVALVASQPVWAAIIARARGEFVSRDTWIGIGLAIVGVIVLTGVDFQVSARAAFGDLLALVGGALAAAYVSVGSVVRRTVSTATYATGCYLVAAAALLVVCLAAGLDLWGYDASTWLALIGLTAGAQLLGHTLFNRVLRSLSAMIVSVAILFEVVGASLIAAVAFDESPPLAAVPAGLLVLGGVVLVVRRTPQSEEIPLG